MIFILQKKTIFIFKTATLDSMNPKGEFVPVTITSMLLQKHNSGFATSLNPANY